MEESKLSPKGTTQVSQDELDLIYRELLAQAQGVQSKWRSALTRYQSSPGRADLVRYIKFVIGAVGHTAQVFAETLQAQVSQEQMAALWSSAEQSRQSLNVLSSQCDDFVQRHAPASASSSPTASTAANAAPSHESYAESLLYLRRFSQTLARHQRYQRALITTALGIREVSGDKLVLRALRAMAASLEIERHMLHRRRLAVRAFASLPMLNLPKAQRRVNRWTRKARHMAADLESRERYLAHLITWN